MSELIPSSCFLVPCVYLPLAAGRESDVNEAASVDIALVGAALGGLGLLLLLNLFHRVDVLVF